MQTLGFKVPDTGIHVVNQVLFENSADFKNSGELLIDMIDNFIKQCRSEDKGADKLPELLLQLFGFTVVFTVVLMALTVSL